MLNRLGDSLYWLLMTSPKWLLDWIIPFSILSKIRHNVSADFMTKNKYNESSQRHFIYLRPKMQDITS